MTDPTEEHWTGGSHGVRGHAVLCANPSPMTLEGTNTWVLCEPGSDRVVVVDPGPAHAEGHLQAVLKHIDRLNARVALTLLTHSHADHAGAIDRWCQLTGSPVRGGDGTLTDGEALNIGGLQVEVVSTPGHTSDSVCFLLPAEQVLLTGDTILGRGSTVVAHPDGNLTAYLESLERLRGLAASGAVTSLAPGHGPVLQDAAATIEYYRSHRQERLEQVRAAVAELEHAPSADVELADRVVQLVYADVPRAVWPAARQSVLAQLEYLGPGGHAKHDQHSHPPSG